MKFAKFSRTRWWLLLEVVSGNVFAEKMFTLQLNNIIPRAILKKKLPSSYREKMRWERRCQIKLCLHLVYFHSYSFATDMANMSPNIFNVSLKNLQKEMRNEKPLLKYGKAKQSPGCVIHNPKNS